MPRSVFFSWQSDVKINRNFIRSALDEAVARLETDSTIDEALREFVVDQDTQGVPGTPTVVDAILEKIRSADIFVADLTIINGNELHRRTPNPNVLLEYGYAIHALSDRRIIGVFNENFGSPEDLPFDLKHKRWPIRFTLKEKAADRAEQKTQLVQALVDAIKAIIPQFEVVLQPRTQTKHIPIEPADGVGLLRQSEDYLCVTQEGTQINFDSGPYSFLRFIPGEAVQELSNRAATQIVQRILQPISGARSGGGYFGRHSTGAVTYWSTQNNPNVALDASELFLSGEIWGNNSYLLRPLRSRGQDIKYIPTGAFEECFVDAFVNYIEAAKEIGVTLPISVNAGVVGIKNFTLAVEPRYFMYDKYAGHILEDRIVFEQSLDNWESDAFDFLEPFFERVYDKAGVIRPPTRQEGRRAR